MEPPWEKYPEIPARSIGWRMGTPEDYYYNFYRWFVTLPPEQQTEFRSSHPEPRKWKGYYDMLIQRAQTSDTE